MVTTTRLYSVAEFFDFIAENPERDYELIAGEITEVVSDGYASRVALRVGSFIERFVDDNDPGRVTGADGGYMVAGKPYIPDVAYLSYARQPTLQQERGYNVLAPDLAVEVLSPTDDNLDVKVANYLAAGTVVWRIDPRKHTVIVFEPGKPPVEHTDADTLNGGKVLPGFNVTISDCFPKQK